MAAVVKETVNALLEKLHISAEPAPPPPTDAELQKLRDKYEEARQGHVFHFYEDLAAGEKASLYAQLSKIDPLGFIVVADKAVSQIVDNTVGKLAHLEPLPSSASSSLIDAKEADVEKWYEHGLQLISQNTVAVVLMAGGQGTRLGSSAPKGCFDISLPSKKSLFQLQAERIVKVQRLAERKFEKDEGSVIVPWYIMTSGPTRAATEAFFKQHNHFGLKTENVVIFEQGVLPCISNDVKILLETKSKVAVAPDGNGGIYQALITAGIVSDMEKRGTKHIHAYCVDNCLVKVADPTFIGFAAEKNVHIATKVVRKRNAKESVGLIVQKNGKPDVVEYSEIDTETVEAKDPGNPELLKFRAANIVNHYYSFAFLNDIPEWAHKLPHHVARKKIPYVDLESGAVVKPEKPNGIKLEQFVFDCFPFLDLEKFACLEVRREDEFSPLKNAKGTGEDDPDTSRKDIMQQGKRWAEAAGSVVVSEGHDSGIEMSPLISYGGEGLEFLKGKTIHAPAVVEKED